MTSNPQLNMRIAAQRWVDQNAAAGAARAGAKPRPAKPAQGGRAKPKPRKPAAGN